MVKMNLPPLLGRRDAAYEKFSADFSIDCLELTTAERRELYGKWFRLLESASRDTESVIVILSNPDTSLRERRMANLLELSLDCIAFAAGIGRFEDHVFAPDDGAINLVPAPIETKARRRLEEFLKVERDIVATMDEATRTARENILRQRDYTRKNFSAHNLARYNRAYSEFFNSPTPGDA